MNIRESMDELRQAAKRLGLPITDSRVCLEVMKAHESKQVKSKK
ncbi:MAG: hypothetical protein SNG27_07370 [Rikenellaceae bacterium]